MSSSKISTLGFLVITFLSHLLEGHKATTGKTPTTGDRPSRSSVQRVLQLDEESFSQWIEKQKRTQDTISKLLDIYRNDIKPLEDIYKFNDLNRHVFSEAEINAEPMVLFIGPWSTGKTTMINYILGIENQRNHLFVGAEPTTSEFVVVMNGQEYQPIEGLVLAADKTKKFCGLESFGQGFLERLQGLEMPNSLLQQITLVDTPGIIENRKQQERGYPFYDVMKWFIDRADLIFVVFDPTKLDVGTELERLFSQLKGRESIIRIILNKADSLSTQELMRVYGALFWNLAPLINVTEPPRLYVGSFWDKPYKVNTSHKLFQDEEESLLQDMNEIINNRVQNKIAFLRQHAYLVRIHVLLLDRYLQAYQTHKSIFKDSEEILQDIVSDPGKYNIYHSVLAESGVSKYDLPSPKAYYDFFRVHALNLFKPLSSNCKYFGGCLLDRLVHAISEGLPSLMNELQDINLSCTSQSCDKP